ncbi:MAG: DUF2809 domain-containing protein [Ectobacillus sp.]
MPYTRKRLAYGVILILVMLLGLYTRKRADLIPSVLNPYIGDALWALMIFIGFGILFNTANIKTVAFIALSFCYAIEWSQLYHGYWIDELRGTTLGGLVLGYGFLWSDLLAYFIGIASGALVEYACAFINKKKFSIKNIPYT